MALTRPARHAGTSVKTPTMIVTIASVIDRQHRVERGARADPEDIGGTLQEERCNQQARQNTHHTGGQAQAEILEQQHHRHLARRETDGLQHADVAHLRQHLTADSVGDDQAGREEAEDREDLQEDHIELVDLLAHLAHVLPRADSDLPAQVASLAEEERRSRRRRAGARPLASCDRSPLP